MDAETLAVHAPTFHPLQEDLSAGRRAFTAFRVLQTARLKPINMGFLCHPMQEDLSAGRKVPPPYSIKTEEAFTTTG